MAGGGCSDLGNAAIPCPADDAKLWHYVELHCSHKAPENLPLTLEILNFSLLSYAID